MSSELLPTVICRVVIEQAGMAVKSLPTPSSLRGYPSLEILIRETRRRQRDRERERVKPCLRSPDVIIKLMVAFEIFCDQLS